LADAAQDRPLTNRHNHDGEEERRQALRDLDRLSHEGDLLASNRVAQGVRRVARHFGGDDGEDRVEVWGQRIGRGLSVLLLLALLWYLATTYL